MEFGILSFVAAALGLSLVASVIYIVKRQRLSIDMERREASVMQSAQSLEVQLGETKKKIADLERELVGERQTRIEAQSAVKNTREQLDNERQLLNQAREQLTLVFKSSAAEALKNNNEQFMLLAKQILTKQTDTAKGDLAQKEQAIENLVKPLKETIDKYQVHLRELENSRQKSYATVETELKAVIETGRVLSLETRALKDALKKPHVRGRWGEIQLKNCVELAGMSEFADVTFQDYHEVDDNRFIPDMTVRMPGGRVVIVDSKAPLDAFIASLESTTDEVRTSELARHGRQVKEHVRKLSQKAYQDQLSHAADFTVMFLPNESFLYAALEHEPDLVEFALQKKILIATPPTFVGLLKVIRYGWQEEKITQNAHEISEAGSELHKRLVDFVESFENIGKHLDRARIEFETGKTRLTSRVILQAKKMETLGVKRKKELPESFSQVTLLDD